MGADLPAQRDPFAVNLLWTGGWDSTFQLLRLLIDFRRPVIPHYLIDAARPSSAVEIMTMDRIRARLLRDFPDAAALLPTRAFGVSLVERDEAIEAAYRSVRSESSIGEQYDWLARFCMQNGIQDMELCIHKDDKAHPVVAPFVAAQTDPHGYRTFRLDPQFEGSREYAVFGRFSFPLLDFSKLDMAAHAQQRGWTEVMGMTWFCHRPRRNMQPCGHCNPCRFTIEEGLGWRIPRSSRIAGMYPRLIRALKAPAKSLLGRRDPRPGHQHV